MRVKRLWIACIGALLLALSVVALLGGGHATAAVPKVLKIGTVSPISGPLGVIGLTWGRGFNLCAEWLNKQGGVKVGGDRYQVEFIHEDSKASPEAATAGANKLVFQDKVNFVIGDVLNPCSEAIYGVTKPAGVLQVLLYTMDPYREDQWGIGSDNPLLVLLMPTITLSYDPFFKYLRKTYPNVKNLAYGVANAGTFTRMVKESASTAEATGFKVVGGETLDYSWTDFNPFMTSLLKNKPDAIYIIHGGGPDLVAVELKAARQMGFKGPIISFGSASPALIPTTVGAQDSHDIICNQAYAMAPEATKMMKEVTTMWEAKYPKEAFVDDALMAWDEVWVLAQGIEKANSLKPEAVLKALEGMSKPGSLKTTFGPGHMGGAKTLGVNRMLVRPFPITVVQDGKINMVRWVSSELP
ncbi:MAG: ABC transporter substrate-binding protein [Syntrophorhabdales bacterium]|jgi:branched-chain amino acid transport system substrate-binding protein